MSAKEDRSGRASRSGPSIPRSQRTRRPIELTLSDEARAALDRIATGTGESRSAVVDRLVLRDKTKKPSPREG